MSDETARGAWRREYDLVDDSTPEPVDPAPVSEDTPAVNPFAPPPPPPTTGHTMTDYLRRAGELGLIRADLSKRIRERDEARRDRDAARADADRLAATLQWYADPGGYPKDPRPSCGRVAADKGTRARAALARHEETNHD